MQVPLTVEYDVHFRNGHRGRKRLRNGEEPKTVETEPGRVPRVSRLMALAIHFDELLRSGQVNNYTDLARLGCVTGPRVTQIMNLRNLAPDIQEAILLLPKSPGGRDAITEKALRPITAVTDWRAQRRMWNALTQTRAAAY